MKAFRASIFCLLFSCTLSPDLAYYASGSGPADPLTGAPGWFCAVSTAPFGHRYGHGSVVFRSSHWMIGGVSSYWIVPGYSSSFILKNDVWFSPDGSSWYCATTNSGFAPRYDFGLAVYSNALWLIGGTDGSNVFPDVWRSTNGTNWVQVTASNQYTARIEHSVVCFQDKLWMIGGVHSTGALLSDVLYSGDGSNWTLVSTNMISHVKSRHNSLVFKNRLWVLGGVSFGSEVWSSLDGTNWTCSIAPYDQRYYAGAAEYRNRIWMVCGQNSPYNYLTNDMWSSSNGVDWKLEISNVVFTNRCHFSMVSFNNSLLIIGGIRKGEYCGDVWYYRE